MDLRGEPDASRALSSCAEEAPPPMLMLRSRALCLESNLAISEARGTSLKWGRTSGGGASGLAGLAAARLEAALACAGGGASRVSVRKTAPSAWVRASG